MGFDLKNKELGLTKLLDYKSFYQDLTNTARHQLRPVKLR